MKAGLEEFIEDKTAINTIVGAYSNLVGKFKAKTGLSLSLKFWDEECEGSDIEEGIYWEVDGIYLLTETGKKNTGNFERVFWTTFG